MCGARAANTVRDASKHIIHTYNDVYIICGSMQHRSLSDQFGEFYMIICGNLFLAFVLFTLSLQLYVIIFILALFVVQVYTLL